MTRLPQLEQELEAAAARLQGPRRLVAPAVRVALAVAAVVAVVVGAVTFAAGDDEEGGRPRLAAPLEFAPEAKLQEMLGVFRRPATAADDVGLSKDDFNEIPNHQPGEDPTRSRRVEWPDASIFLWPMRDGVCYGIGGEGGCLPLDHLQRVGVSVEIQDSTQGTSVSGVVIDGIGEVVLTASNGPELHVPVSENFFFVDLDEAAAKLGTPGWETRVERVRWRYSGEQRSFNVGRLLQRLVPPAPTPPPGISEGAPGPSVEPLAGSASEPLDFTVAGTRYTAIGFQTSRSMVCATLTNIDAGTGSGTGCLSAQGLRDSLERKPAHLFSAGGGGAQGSVYTGFARDDVTDLVPMGSAGDATVVLSNPWRPEPWEGEPIRFFLVFTGDSSRQEPVPPPQPSLRVRLTSGETVQIP